jgi:hypothetical protein
MPIMAITTNNSTRVNPERAILPEWCIEEPFVFDGLRKLAGFTVLFNYHEVMDFFLACDQVENSQQQILAPKVLLHFP